MTPFFAKPLHLLLLTAATLFAVSFDSPVRAETINCTPITSLPALID